MIKLPSNYVPYTFTVDDLEMNPMTGKELALMSKAVIADDISYAIESINNTLNIDAGTLAIGDFYALMLYARFISMPDSTMEANWLCQGNMYEDTKTHIRYNTMQLQAMVKAYQDDPDNNPNPDHIEVETVACEHKNVKSVVYEDFHAIMLDENTVLPEGVDFPRARLLPSLLEAFSDPESCLLAPAAQWLAEGDTVHDKIILMKEAPLTLYDTLSKCNVDNVFGLVQTVKKACSNCGTEQLLNMQITPDIFFRV